MSVPRVSSLSTLPSRLMVVFDITAQSGVRGGRVKRRVQTDTGPILDSDKGKFQAQVVPDLGTQSCVVVSQMHSDCRPQ